jgi:hypothetical protein
MPLRRDGASVTFLVGEVRSRMAGKPAIEARYAAFLSYSHKDAAEARWLHRRLESYRLPRRLVGSAGERGEVPARLVPIFLDREELPAGHDLSETIRGALAESASLIVICSSASAASPWVGMEISAFRELHPDQPVLAAIIDGDPAQCFPSALSAGGSEPLAADLRPEGDGHRLGFLKLVAGLSGVGLDALVQRDAQRRIRRVTAVTIGALTAMLIMAVLTVFALSARREAERQRAEAEGLIEFMLTDLRGTLEGVGKLKALDDANGKALSYYTKQDVRSLKEESLGRRARIQHLIGDDALAREEPEKAFAAFEGARKTTAEQVARHPESHARWIEHIKSLNSLGRVAELRKDWGEAIAHYQAASGAADRLVRAAPENPDFLARSAAAAVNVGNIYFRSTQDYAVAERYYSKAVSAFGLAAAAKPADPEILMSQANALGWLADSFFMRELWPQSLAARRRQVAIVQPLYDRSPDNAQYMFRLAAAERGLAHSLSRTAAANEGRRRAALEHLMRAHGISRRLSAWDPSNKDWSTLAGKLERDFRKAEFRSPAARARRSQKQPAQEVVR